MRLTILFISLFSASSFCDDIELVRYSFHQINNKDELSSFLDNFKDSSCESYEPFIAAASMQMARYAFITKKMKYFNMGKEKLEYYIINNPKNLEAKYLRLLIQKEIPSFLNYNDSIENDRKFIELNLAASNLSKEYQKLILQNIKK